jgi:molybdopterin synthase sulfur carrier subunit
VSVSVSIPTPLRTFTCGEKEVTVDGACVGDALAALVRRFPDLRRHVYTEAGDLRRFVGVYLDEEDVRFLEGLGTPVRGGHTVTIMPSIAGG